MECLSETQPNPAETLSIRYEALKAESKRIGERNDCTVIAFAMIYDMTYLESHSLLMRLGRQVCRGFNAEIATRHFNLTRSMKVRPKQPNGSKYTIKTITNTIPVGKYLIFTDGHILACIDGKIYDWTEDRKHRVTHYIQVGSLLESL